MLIIDENCGRNLRGLTKAIIFTIVDEATIKKSIALATLKLVEFLVKLKLIII